MSGPEQRLLVAPDDGALGPLLRVSDDRLAPHAGYGWHEHRAVDVVAVVLAGSLHHRWGDGAALLAGDVAVLRAGTGVRHDELAGGSGARVLQCYLRAGMPTASPSHGVHRAPRGWVDLGRPDARLWVGPARSEVPVGEFTAVGDGLVVVWGLATSRPAWAID